MGGRGPPDMAASRVVRKPLPSSAVDTAVRLDEDNSPITPASLPSFLADFALSDLQPLNLRSNLCLASNSHPSTCTCSHSTNTREQGRDTSHTDANKPDDTTEGQVETPPANQSTDPPPDGGLVAWLQVVGCFFCWFNSWGITNAFGVFQTFYEFNTLETDSPSQISWIGSLQSFLLLFVGSITGPAYDAGYFKILIWSGTFLITFGYMMTSLCTKYWQVVLAQGLVVGVGSGCLFVPSVSILPQYFSKRRALANGIAAAGSSFGGVIYPIAFRQLIPRLGFAWAVRVVAFIALGTSAVAIALLRERVKPKKKRLLFDISAFKEAPFALFTSSLFFAMIGIYIPAFYVQSYAIYTGRADPDIAPFLLPILNAAGVFGRIVPNFFADQIGPLNVLIPSTIIAALMVFLWIAVTNVGGLIVVVVFFGFFSGCILSLPTMVVVSLAPDLGVIGTRMGTTFSTAALGLLIGTPLSGAIVGKTGNFAALQGFGGTMLMLSAILALMTRFSSVGFHPKVRA